MVRTRNAIDADDVVVERDHDSSSRVTRSRQLTFDDANTVTLENGDIEDHERELMDSEIHTRRARKKNSEKPILKSEVKREEWENVADHETCLVRGGHRKEHKSVRISIIKSARTSPRRSALRKPRRYLDSDDEELDDDITYEKLARGDHLLGSRRRRIATPMSAPPATRVGRPRRERYMHRDDRTKYMYEQDEPRRSGRQRKLLYDTFNQSLIAMMNNAEDRNLTEESNKDDSIEMPNEQTNELPPRKRRRQEVDPMPESEMQDMYARVKRKRRQVKRDMYGIPVTEEENEEEEVEQQGGDDDGSSESESEEEEQKGRSYSFREHRPRTQMYEINWEEGKRKKHDFPAVFRQHTPPPPQRKKKKVPTATLR